ncbi:MAG TPA: PAS domain S-box protein [Candidatus Acidoferrum sp.]|nr:PAS domain S-box protein [Candidatus Acidoferrum sp.]
MRWKTEKRWILTGFIASAIILAFVGWESYRDTVRTAEAAASRKHSFEIQLALDEAAARLVDAETGQRGYLLTGDDAYLEPYHAATKSLGQVMNQVKQLVADDPAQLEHVQELEPLVQHKLDELQVTIDLRRSKDLAAANRVVQQGSGKELMDRIREVLSEMGEAESRIRALRTEEMARASARSSRTVVLGNLTSLFLLLLVFASLLRSLSERKRAQEELAKSEKWLSTTISSIGDAVISTDMNGTVTFMNPVAEALTGWSQREASGKSMDLVFDIINKDTRKAVENPVKKVFREGKVVGLADHTLLLSRNGKEFDIEDSAAPIVSNEGESFGVVLVFRDITEKKQTEQETKLQKELLELILESVAEGVVVADSNGKFLLFNSAAEHILGVGATDGGPTQWSDRYGTYLPDGVTQYPSGELPLARAMRGENVDDVEVFIRNAKVPEGRLISTTGRPLRNDEGMLRGGVVVLHDITEQKRAEEALRQSEERYRLLFDSNPHPVWVYDLQSLAILDVNQAAIRNYGYSRGEFLSLTIKDIRPAEDVPALLENTRNTPKDREDIGIWKHLKKNGAQIDVEVTSHPLEYSGKAARLVVATDITTRKKAEEALRQSEERFRLLISEVVDYAILMLDPEGTVVSWNAGAERIKGYEAREIVGRNFSCFYPAEEVERGKPARQLKLALEQGRVEDEGWRVRKDGSRFWADVVITALHDATGRLRGFAKVTRDVTEQKRAQELILRAKEEAERASKFKDQFLSTMSHELRTPLNAVLGFSDLLAEELYGPLNDRQRRYVEHIHTGGKHLLRLISDILDLSKIEAGRMELTREDVKVASAITEVSSALYPLAAKKSQSLVQDVDPNLCVRADAMRFKQVLMNLVGNAIKFTQEGGQIKLSAIQVKDQVRIEVRDNGPGISPEQQQKIFEAFYRVAQQGNVTEGTGLGLAITARLVELHGSKLQVESQPGKGACLYFTLPLAIVTHNQPEHTPIVVSSPRSIPRILVVEDDPAAGQLIQSQLASSGYEAVKCDQPERVTDLAAELMPDAITLDLIMKPVHGLEVLRRLKNDPRTALIPVIVVTIVDQPAIGTAFGADEYLLKPVEKTTLLAAVERCLQSRGGGAPKKNILVVEDDLPTLEMIVELLRAKGYDVSVATDGEQARVRVSQALPELVILDLLLPNVSGFELLHEWRSNPRTADLPVFVLTSKDLTKEEREYLRVHSESLFRKQDSWREPLIQQLGRVMPSPDLGNS